MQSNALGSVLPDNRHELRACNRWRGITFKFSQDRGNAPFFNGIVRIGEFDGGMDAIERQSEDLRVTIERAE